MGYSGDTLRIPCNRGGLFHSRSGDLIPPEMIIHPSRNMNLHENGRRKRGGSAHVNGSALTSTPEILGIHQFKIKNGSEFILLADDLGQLWKNYTTTIKTGLTADEFVHISTYADKAYFCKKSDQVQVWDGVAGSTSDISNPPTDWASGNFPQQMITHGRGASERRWAFGCIDTPHYLYASELFDGDDFSDANVILIPIETGDGYGIMGGEVFGDALIAFGKKKAYIIDDTSYDTDLWGYVPASWEGGVAHHRLIIKTPTDLILMAEDGTIYSVRAAQVKGDYVSASLTAPTHIDLWIQEYLDLSRIDQFHGVYDPVLRCVKIFVVRSGMTTVDTALVYFIDRPAQEAWTIHDNQDYVSGYSCASSAQIRKATGDLKVYTGGYSGFLWELETANRNDNSNPYWGGFKTPQLDFGNPRMDKIVPRGRIITEPEGDYSAYINWWVDGVQQTQKTVTLSALGGTLGSFVLGTDVLGGGIVTEQEFELGNIGNRFQFEIYNAGADQDLFISQLLLDFKFLGKEVL